MSGKILGIEKDLTSALVDPVITALGWLYPQLSEKKEQLKKIFTDEEEKFRKTLTKGFVILEKALLKIDKEDIEKKTLREWAQMSFDLFQSVGYPEEIFVDDLEDKGIHLDHKDFHKEFLGRSG
ncbi:MAG: Alanine-tRNA ligase [candidate division WWE3 bacterium GW2011_GWB1_42_41]|nr:MAG: Alanine-tRNA ligase [candidate division WWE3 bacterium GW2011_GWB1_42_41]